MDTANVNRKVKDKLFCYIFGNEGNKQWTLELFNAVNGSNYTDPNEITYTTIDDVIYVKRKNDVSFLISGYINLYEQQSTYNPNMPVRALIYAGMLFSAYIENNGLSLYSRKRLKLPTPKCICFYNGTDYQEERKVLKLSDSFEKESDIELSVLMLNINMGNNEDLLNECKPLMNYSWFVEKVRTLSKEMGIKEAVDIAIDEMPESFAIKGFLRKNKSEVELLCITSFDERDEKCIRDEGFEEGFEKGVKGTISIAQKLGQTKEQTISLVQKQYEMAQEDAEKYVNKYWDEK